MTGGLVWCQNASVAAIVFYETPPIRKAALIAEQTIPRNELIPLVGRSDAEVDHGEEDEAVRIARDLFIFDMCNKRFGLSDEDILDTMHFLTVVAAGATDRPQDLLSNRDYLRKNGEVMGTEVGAHKTLILDCADSSR